MPVSTGFVSAALAQQTEEVFVILLTIDCDPLEPLEGGGTFQTLYISSDNADVLDVEGQSVRGTQFNGNDYIFYPFELTLPPIAEATMPTAKLSIDNVHRDIVYQLRHMVYPPTITIEVGLASALAAASTPEEREAAIDLRLEGFKLRNVTYDALTVEGDLALERYLNEPYPAQAFGPGSFPGMYG